jgi:hypothetical protein
MARRSARSSRISFGTDFLVDGLGKGSATLEGARALALTTAEFKLFGLAMLPKLGRSNSPSAAWWLAYFECHGGVASVERGYH